MELKLHLWGLLVVGNLLFYNFYFVSMIHSVQMIQEIKLGWMKIKVKY